LLMDYGKPLDCACASCPLAQQPFCPHLTTPNATHTWLAESPGRQEILRRTPLIGPTGTRLDRAAREAGIVRAHANIGNSVACLPLKGMSDSDWGKAVKCCAPYRTQFLQRHSGPIFSMGKWALKGALGLDSIQKWYGYPQESRVEGVEGRVVLPALHPTFSFIHAPWWGAEFDRSIQRFAEILHGTWKPFVKPPLLWRAPDYELVAALDRLDGKLIAHDAETAGIDPQFDKLICHGFSDGKEAVTLIWPPSPEVLEALFALLRRTELFVAHNAQHDLLALESNGICWWEFFREEQIVDTINFHAILYPDMPHSLSIASARYSMPRWKAEYHDESEAKGSAMFAQALESHTLMDRLCEYNGLDCVSDAWLGRDLRAEMAVSLSSTQRTYSDLVDRFWVALDMRRRGVPVNLALREEKQAKFKRHRDTAEARFNKLAQRMFWPAINLGKKATTNDVRWLFFDYFGLPALDWTKAGRAKLDAWTLQRWAHGGLAGREAACAAKLVLRMRRGEHMHGMVESLPISPDGRLHSGWNPWGALTDRWASSKPNLLNLPKRGFGGIRDLITVEPGCSIVGADMSKVELRVIAILANDLPLIEAFAKGVDVHMANAIDLFGPKATKAQRDLAKRLVYGFNYGAAAETVWKALVTQFPKLALKVIVHLRKQWFKKHPAIAAYHKKVLTSTLKTRQLRSGSGPRTWFFFPGKVDPNELYNRPIQAAVAKAINDAIVALYREGWDVRLMCHDEICLMVPFGREPEAVDALFRHMEAPHALAGGMHSLPIDPFIGDNWGTPSEALLDWVVTMELLGRERDD